MSKLTLTVDPEVVRQAKIYAASQQQSLSGLVENFLRSLPVQPDNNEPVLQGAVADLAGIIREEDLERLDEYTEYLKDKYQ